MSAKRRNIARGRPDLVALTKVSHPVIVRSPAQSPEKRTTMDFSFSEQQVAVRDTVRRLCREHQHLVGPAEENEALPREVFARWGELGLLGVRYPESDGGMGNGLR